MLTNFPFMYMLGVGVAVVFFFSKINKEFNTYEAKLKDVEHKLHDIKIGLSNLKENISKL